jgi:hypothetical protein
MEGDKRAGLKVGLGEMCEIRTQFTILIQKT